MWHSGIFRWSMYPLTFEEVSMYFIVSITNRMRFGHCYSRVAACDLVHVSSSGRNLIGQNLLPMA